MRNAFLVFLACLTTLACTEKEASEPVVVNQPVANESRSIEVIADEYLAALIQRRPELGTNYSLPGVRHDRLFDNSLQAQTAWQAREDAWLSELEQIGSPIDVGSRDWVSYGILYETLAGKKASRLCRNELWSASTATA